VIVIAFQIGYSFLARGSSSHDEAAGNLRVNAWVDAAQMRL